MPDFSYKALSSDGHERSGQLAATDERTARLILAGQGLQQVQLGKVKASAVKTRKQADHLEFLRLLSGLLRKHMPVLDALRLLSKNSTAPEMKQLAGTLLRPLLEGKHLSWSLRQVNFPPTVCAMVDVGEATGQLEKVVASMVTYLQEQRRVRKQVINALSYPLFLVGAAGSVLMFFLLFLLPRLESLFKSLGGKLPLATRILMGAGNIAPWVAVGGAILAIISAIWISQLLRSEPGRKKVDALLLGLPLSGTVLRKAALARLCSALGIMLENGLKLPLALDHAQATLGNRILVTEFSSVRRRIQEGTKLTKALEECPFFPAIGRDLVTVGENTGQLAPVFIELGADYSQDLEEYIQKTIKVVTASVLAVVFSLVAGIAVGIVMSVVALSSTLAH